MIRRLLVVVLLICAIPLVLAVLYNVVNPVSTLMLGRWISGERVERVWTPLADMAPVLVRTVIASEDASFCHNPGVDFQELRNAVEKADEIEDVRGASTISMQLAKNLFLWPGRDLIRKAFEFPLALWLNLVMSKQRLIEIYLNIAEWGPDGEFGVEAGAQRAFKIPAAKVNATQASLLAVMLPNPIVRNAGAAPPGLSRLAARLRQRVPKEGPELVSCLTLADRD